MLLPGGENDRRIHRITALALPVHDPRWLTAPTAADQGTTAVRPQDPQVLPRGGGIDLPTPQRTPAPKWDIPAGWAPRADCEINVVAFILDEDEQVTFDEDFIFYGAPESPAGIVRLLTGDPTAQTIAGDLGSLPLPRRARSSSPLPSTAPPPSGGSAQSGSALPLAAAGTIRPGHPGRCNDRTRHAARGDLPQGSDLAPARAVGQATTMGSMPRGYGVRIAE
ncbi:TerD family protein [Streptomyces sp. NBC_00316]|uniref:TerD family protein n=1 Tax=Streptomyces sp. NBC_00316 TaxID=2975710 RepID=UPI002E2A58BF|nr:TerD family protein [Streptomyces sp. NBC_00316]